MALAFYISHKEDFQELRPLNLLFLIFHWGLKNNIKVYDFGTLLIMEFQIWGLDDLRKVLVMVFLGIVLKFWQSMSLKRLGKESLIYGFGHVVSRLVTFLLLPIYTHTFSPKEYGIIFSLCIYGLCFSY